MNAEVEAPFLSVSEVALILGVSRSRGYQLAAEGFFPTVRAGERRILVPRAAFQAWVEMQNVRALAGTVDHRQGQPLP